MTNNLASASQIQSYILRLWPERQADAPVWRVSLTLIPNGERIGFASLESAFQFLKEQIERRSDKE